MSSLRLSPENYCSACGKEAPTRNLGIRLNDLKIYHLYGCDAIPVTYSLIPLTSGVEKIMKAITDEHGEEVASRVGKMHGFRPSPSQTMFLDEFMNHYGYDSVNQVLLELVNKAMREHEHLMKAREEKEQAEAAQVEAVAEETGKQLETAIEEHKTEAQQEQEEKEKMEDLLKGINFTI